MVMANGSRVQRNFSLDAEHIRFLELDAEDHGHKDNLSRSLQRILDRLAEVQYGSGWRRSMREREQPIASTGRELAAVS